MPDRLRYATVTSARKHIHRGHVTTSSIGPLKLVRDGLPSEIFHDTYRYLIRARWLELFGLIVVVFAGANCLFAIGYLIDGGIENARHASFADAFFFSVQTMATIGYGKMAPISTGANFLVAAEALFGLMGLALITGLVFAKFALPSSAVRFSRYVVISQYDGVTSLMFRMANARADEIVDAQIQVTVTRTTRTREGQTILRVRDLELLRSRNPMFGLTWTAIHPITESSPLYKVKPEELKPNMVWLLVSLIGLDGTLSQTTHARHVYSVEDFKWGMRFVDLFRQEPDGSWYMDLDDFDEIEAAPIPAGEEPAALIDAGARPA
jgi:inward rectifier potassium channel